jgi:hypothetical protein
MPGNAVMPKPDKNTFMAAASYLIRLPSDLSQHIASPGGNKIKLTPLLFMPGSIGFVTSKGSTLQ